MIQNRSFLVVTLIATSVLGGCESKKEIKRDPVLGVNDTFDYRYIQISIQSVMIGPYRIEISGREKERQQERLHIIFEIRNTDETKSVVFDDRQLSMHGDDYDRNIVVIDDGGTQLQKEMNTAVINVAGAFNGVIEPGKAITHRTVFDLPHPDSKSILVDIFLNSAFGRELMHGEPGQTHAKFTLDWNPSQFRNEYQKLESKSH